MALIQDKDIFNAVVGKWIALKDVVSLDSAIIEDTERSHFLNLLESVPYQPPFHNELEVWWKNHKACLRWLQARRMLSPEGCWHVNQKLWMLLVDNLQSTKPLMSKWEAVFFEGFHSSFDMKGLDVCESLKSLQLCNYNYLEFAADNHPSCPQLSHLALKNCKICPALLNLFSACPIKSLVFQHVTCDPLTDATALPLVNHYLNNVATMKVMGKNLEEFFNAFCQETSADNRWEVVHLDHMHSQGSAETNLEAFLKKSPHLVELHMERMCVDVGYVFSLIAKYCPKMKYVHLNHLRLSMTPRTANGEFANLALPFHQLKISTLIPPMDDKFLQVMTLTQGKILDLHLSFAERLTEGGLMAITDLCPQLTSFQWEEKKEKFVTADDVAAATTAATAAAATTTIDQEILVHLQQVINIMASVPNVRLSTWPQWYTEDMKLSRMDQKEVKFLKGSFE